MADGLEHAPDLAVAALMDRELDPRGPKSANRGRRRPAVLELDALREPLERLVRRLVFELGLVALFDLVLRMSQPVCQLTVVREQERARGVGVEPAGRRRRPGRPARRTCSAGPAPRSPSRARP